MEIERQGAGRPLLLIHGSPGTAQSWNGVTNVLSDRYHLLLPTLPGYAPGDGADDLPDHDVSDIAATLAASLPALDAPLAVVGHSFGGNVALRLAMDAQVAIDRLILLEPVAFAALDANGNDAAYRLAQDFFADYVADVRAGRPSAIARMIDYWTRPGAFAALPAAMQNMLIGRAGANARDVAATFRERYDPDALAVLSVPVMLVNGSHSPQVAKDIAAALAERMPDATQCTIDGADHMMTASHPVDVAQVIENRIDH